MRYLIVIEQGPGNWSAYSPQVPGCVATGASLAAVTGRMREALAFHLEGLRAQGLPAPAGLGSADEVLVLEPEGGG